jgi:parallel beta-helix repeat protein
MKKYIAFLLMAFIGIKSLFANGHYFSASGNDLNAGTSPASPKKTLKQLNSDFKTYAAGDTVYLKRGDTFYGTISVGNSGAVNKPIVISDYGKGAKPVVTGFTTITDWQSEGGGIYSKVITAAAQTNMVLIDGMQYGVGRYPDAGWLTVTAATSNTDLTIAGLGTSVNWTGASLATKKNDFQLDRNTITNQNGDMLTYSGGGGSNANFLRYGTFICNDLRTVTSYGEWYHDFAGTGKFYMYFGTVNPNKKKVQVAAVNNLFSCGSFSNIKVQNISFSGSIADGVLFNGRSANVFVQHCKVSFAGSIGIRFSNAGITNSAILYDSVLYTNMRGISSDAQTSKIQYNYVYGIGLIFGQSLTNFSPVTDGIYFLSDTCAYNTIRKVGYNGISLKNGGAAYIGYNLIDSAQYMFNDGGGIYLGGDVAYTRTLDHNIIINLTPNTSGCTRLTSLCGGIYLDEEATNCVVTNNVIANHTLPGSAGIKLHKANKNIITGNLIYNCDRGCYFFNSAGNNNLTGNTLKRNTFIAKTASQLIFRYGNNVTNSLSSFATADSNSYQRPIAPDNMFEISAKTLAPSDNNLARFSGKNSWQSYTGQDAHSSLAPRTIKNITELDFQYNASAKPIIYNFRGHKKMAANGTVFKNQFTIPAYSGVVFYNLD